MNQKNEIPVYYVDAERLTNAKLDLKSYADGANQILNSFKDLDLIPKDEEEAHEMLFGSTDFIRKKIEDFQRSTLKALPGAIVEQFIHVPDFSKLEQRRYSFQNSRPSLSRINNMLDFLNWNGSYFEVNEGKLKRFCTVYKTDTIVEAEKLAKQVIEAFEKLKEFCQENHYPGAVIEFESFLSFNKSEQRFELDPAGMKYFPLSK